MTRKRPVLWLMAVAVAVGGAHRQAQDYPMLVSGAPIELEGAPGATLRYALHSEAGQYLSVAVQDASESLAFTLTGPDGRKPGQWVMWQRSMRLTVVTGSAGQFVLSAEQSTRGASTFRFGLLLEPMRPASDAEARSVAARLALEDGRVAGHPQTEAAFRDALGRYRHAGALYEAIGDAGGRALAMQHVGATHFQLGETLDAIAAWKEALALARVAGDRGLEKGCLNSVATAYKRLGSFDDSLEALKAAFVVGQALGEPGDDPLFGMGILYSAFGEHRNALDYLERALSAIRAESRRIAGTPDKASIGRNRFAELKTRLRIAAEHESLGDSGRALEMYRALLSDFQDSVPARAEAYSRGGNLLAGLGDYAQALEWLGQALALTGESPSGGAMLLGQMGTVHALLGEPARAIERLDESLKAMPQTENAADLTTLNLLAEAGVGYAVAGEQAKAVACFTRGAASARTAGQIEYEARFLALLARAERDADQLDEARRHIAEALAARESIRLRLRSPDQRARYFSTFRSYYDFDVDLLTQLDERRPGRGFDAEAFAVSERARARGLLELLNEARIDLRSRVDEGLAREEQALRMAISDRETQRQALSGRKGRQPTADALVREIRALSAEYERLQARIRAASPAYAALVHGDPLTLREVQVRVLDGDTLLLEYMLGEERSHLWALTNESLRHFELPGRRDIETLALQAYEGWAKGPSAAARQAPGGSSRAASDLATLLLGPVRSLLGAKRVLVVPDGCLHYIPFGALPSPADGQRPLVWDREVVHAPSASVIAALRDAGARRRPGEHRLAVLADPVFDQSDPRLPKAARGGAAPGASEPGNRESQWSLAVSGIAGQTSSPSRLPFSRREADAILAFVPADRSLKAVDFRASRATALSPELARYRIIHFATHGVANDEQPGLSGLVLSLVDERGRPQDGFLRLGDIFNLDLPADLVVLSACRTALGRHVRGEGVVGLARGFMYAGAPRIVASHWKVDDAATAQLMSRFYEGMLKRNLPPAAALRAAQVSLSRSARWSHPFYWAGFVFQGEWR